MPDSIEALETLLKTRPDRALEGALALLSEARGLSDPETAARAAAVAAYSALATGNPDRALGLARQGQSLKPAETGLRVRLLCAEGISHFQAGRYVESIAILEKALRLSRRSGDRTSLVRSLGNLGIASLEAGRAEKAAAYLREALDASGNTGIPGVSVEALRLQYAEALTLCGRPEEALGLIDGVMSDSGASGNSVVQAEARLGKGESLRLCGRRTESIHSLEEALARANRGGFAMVGVRAAVSLVRARIEDGFLDEAEALAEEWLPRAAAGDLLRYTELLRLRGRVRALRGRFRDAYEDSERAAVLERRSGRPSAAEASLNRERGSLRRKARRLTERLEGWAEAVTHALADLIEARDEVTGQHIDRTREIVLILGERLIEEGTFPRLGPGSLTTIARMAPLHDIGKIAVPDAVLQKPGPLDDAERALMQRHVLVGREILLEASRHIRYDPRVALAADIAGYHHERWDGDGYPEGLAGNDIPLPARLVAMADVYDAIRSERPYKPALGRDTAGDYILENSGRHFDPVIVEAFRDRESDIAGLYP